jgi:uncharacterized protein with HEPN domain
VSRHRDATRLQILLDRSHEVVELLRGRGLDDLRSNRMRALAIEHLLVVIGRAATLLPSAFREAHPEVAWRRLSETADALITEYDHVDIEAAWLTATEGVPRMVPILERALR